MSDLIEKIPYAKTENGQSITLYRIRNGMGSTLDVLDKGCAILAMCVRERSQKMRNVLCNPQNGVQVCGDWHTPLNDRVWEMSEGEDDSVVFRTSAEEDGCLLKAEVRFRLKDFDRLVIDYRTEVSSERKLYLTHKVCFCLDDGDPLETHKIRVFAKQEYSQDDSLTDVPFSLEYCKVTDNGHCYIAEGEEIHTFIELAADDTDLALSAYAGTEGMLMEPVSKPEPGVCFTACELTLPVLTPGEARECRTVYGLDLLYHPGDTVQANPFLFFPQIR